MHRIPRICLNVSASMLVGQASSAATEMLAAALSTNIVGCVYLVVEGESDAGIVAAVEAVAQLSSLSGSAVCLMGRADLAAQAGADAVMVDWQPGAISLHRDLVGHGVAIGVNCGSSLANGIAADAEGADFVRFGPFFPKNGQEADPGIIDWWRESMAKPVIAGGGTTPRNFEEMLWSGADMIELDLSDFQDEKNLSASLSLIKNSIQFYSE